jgi:hypothetical protein
VRRPAGSRRAITFAVLCALALILATPASSFAQLPVSAPATPSLPATPAAPSAPEPPTSPAPAPAAPQSKPAAPQPAAPQSKPAAPKPTAPQPAAPQSKPAAPKPTAPTPASPRSAAPVDPPAASDPASPSAGLDTPRAATEATDAAPPAVSDAAPRAISEPAPAAESAPSRLRDALPDPPAAPAPLTDKRPAVPAPPVDINANPDSPPATTLAPAPRSSVEAVTETVDRVVPAPVPATPSDPTAPLRGISGPVPPASLVEEHLPSTDGSPLLADTPPPAPSALTDVADVVPRTIDPVTPGTPPADLFNGLSLPGTDQTGVAPSGDGLPVVGGVIETVERADTLVTPLVADVPDLGTGPTEPADGPLAALPAPLDPITEPLVTVVDSVTPPSTGDGLPVPPALPRLGAPAPPALGHPLDRTALPQPAPTSTGSGFPAPQVTPAAPVPTAPATAVLDALATDSPAAGAPAAPAGPWALAQLGLAASAVHAAQTPRAGAPPARGSAPLPQLPEPVSSGGSASAGGSGVALSLLLALLFSIAAFALQHYSRLRLPPARLRLLAFVAVIERPG